MGLHIASVNKCGKRHTADAGVRACAVIIMTHQIHTRRSGRVSHPLRSPGPARPPPTLTYYGAAATPFARMAQAIMQPCRVAQALPFASPLPLCGSVSLSVLTQGRLESAFPCREASWRVGATLLAAEPPPSGLRGRISDWGSSSSTLEVATVQHPPQAKCA